MFYFELDLDDRISRVETYSAFPILNRLSSVALTTIPVRTGFFFRSVPFLKDNFTIIHTYKCFECWEVSYSNFSFRFIDTILKK